MFKEDMALRQYAGKHVRENNLYYLSKNCTLPVNKRHWDIVTLDPNYMKDLQPCYSLYKP